MSFCRSNRFLNLKNCAPPPGAYDPQEIIKVQTATLTKADRFKQKDDHIPGPGAFTGDLLNTTVASTISLRKNSSSTPSVHSVASTACRNRLALIRSNATIPTLSLSDTTDELNRELDLCHRQIEEMEQQIMSLTQELEATRNLMATCNNDEQLQTLETESANLRSQLESVCAQLYAEQQRSFNTEQEIMTLRNQLSEKESESSNLDQNLKSIIDKYSALESDLNEVKSNQNLRETDLQKQLLARRQSLDSARTQLVEIEKTNMNLLQNMDHHVETKAELAAQKVQLGEGLKTALIENESLRVELQSLKSELEKEKKMDESVIDELFGDQVESVQKIQKLETILLEKELLLADNLSRVAELKQRLAEKECTLVQVELERSALDKNLVDTMSALDGKERVVDVLMNEKEELLVCMENLESNIAEKQKSLAERGNTILELQNHVRVIEDEFVLKSGELSKVRLEFQQSELESDERRSIMSDLQAQVDILKGDIEERENESAKLRGQISVLVLSYETQTTELEDYKIWADTRIDTLKMEKDQYANELNLKLSEFEGKVDNLVEDRKQLSEKMKEKDQEQEHLQKETFTIMIERDTTRVRLEEEILGLRLSRTNLRTTVTSLEQRLTSLAIENKNLVDSVTSLQECVTSLSGEKIGVSRNLADKVESLSNTMIENEGLVESVCTLQSELRMAEDKIMSYTMQIDELLSKIKILGTQKSRQDKTIQQLNGDVTSIENEKYELKLHNQDLDNEIELLKHEKEESALIITNLESQQSELSGTVEHLHTHILELEKVNDELKGQVGVFTTEKYSYHARIEELESNIGQLTIEKDNLHKQFSNDIKTKLSEMDEQYLSFKNETDALLRERDQLLVEQQEHYEEEISSLEDQLTDAKNDEDMALEAKRWQTMYEELQAKVLPFQAQLDQFEIERQALLSNAKHANHEMEQLGRQYARLLGHQNQKQKIQHVIKLKEENLNLQKEIARLSLLEKKHKRAAQRLQEQLNDSQGKRRFDSSYSVQSHQDKENSQLSPKKDKSLSIKVQQERPRTPLSERKPTEAPQQITTPGNRI